MIAFDGFSEANKVISWLKISWVILSHYGASYAVCVQGLKTYALY